MSRRLASPEADTMSYWPPPPERISVTISSDEPAYLALTWQPVAFSNGLTHCGWVYPSQAIRLSLPAFELVTPAAGNASPTASTRSAAHVCLVMCPPGVRIAIQVAEMCPRRA